MPANKRKYPALLTCMLLLLQLQAQFHVSVCVTDQLTGLPVDSCIVRAATGVSRYTDSTGCIQLALSPGERQITFVARKEAYRTGSTTLFIDRDTSVVFRLLPATQQLTTVTVTAPKENRFGIARLNNVDGTSIHAGKKSEVLLLDDMDANLAANSARQIFSKVPGVNIFETDGSGLQLGIGGRGLNPNRVSNFNTRQNGYDISADALGYPESYYTPPSEAIDRIEILRGAASLQYGTQFGGMINFRFREPDTARFRFITRQTGGSFGFFNSFNSFSGTVKKIKYYTFYQYKRSDGYRPRSHVDLHSAHAMLQYTPGEKADIRVEYTHLDYLAQQPGGLTDKQFETDPSAGYRNRNWFDVNWNLAAVTLNYRMRNNSRINWRTFGLLAGRDALGFLGRPDRADDTTASRDLLRDRYKNTGSELRFLQYYGIGKTCRGVLLLGARTYFGHTNRRQGLADSTAAPHFIYLNPDKPEHSAYDFPSRNVALFAENIFQLSQRLSLTPGIRYEHIRTTSDGYYHTENRDLAGNVIYSADVYEQRSSTRQFLLGGFGVQLKYTKNLELYANVSQNYRSINFNDMRVVNPNFRVDPELQDESGYTIDGGFRYVLRELVYMDISWFYLRYNNRIGTVIREDSVNYTLYNFRTNISDSRNTGVEVFTELDWFRLFRKTARHRLSSFINYSFIDARYISSEQSGFNGNSVELVPRQIIRTGITYRYKEIGITVQHAHTSAQFTDASNATFTPTAIYGLIPAFAVADVSVRYNYKFIGLSAGVNNVLNASYFTRRADGYPGPGILPSDPRNFWVTLQVRL